MKNRPILFSAPMIRAILDDAKTQTRRIVKAKLAAELTDEGWPNVPPLAIASVMESCPYGQPGERLWVRETWTAPPGSVKYDEVLYRADLTDEQMAEERVLMGLAGSMAAVASDRPMPWRPSIHMPRWASRIDLEVTGVRVERLQNITEQDARAEGIQVPVTDVDAPPGKVHVLIDASTPYKPRKLGHEFRAEFACAWERINGNRAPWASNPWVWVVEFRRVDQ